MPGASPTYRPTRLLLRLLAYICITALALPSFLPFGLGVGTALADPEVDPFAGTAPGSVKPLPPPGPPELTQLDDSFGGWAPGLSDVKLESARDLAKAKGFGDLKLEESREAKKLQVRLATATELGEVLAKGRWQEPLRNTTAARQATELFLVAILPDETAYGLIEGIVGNNEEAFDSAITDARVRAVNSESSSGIYAAALDGVSPLVTFGLDKSAQLKKLTGQYLSDAEEQLEAEGNAKPMLEDLMKRTAALAISDLAYTYETTGGLPDPDTRLEERQTHYAETGEALPTLDSVTAQSERYAANTLKLVEKFTDPNAQNTESALVGLALSGLDIAGPVDGALAAAFEYKGVTGEEYEQARTYLTGLDIETQRTDLERYAQTAGGSRLISGGVRNFVDPTVVLGVPLKGTSFTLRSLRIGVELVEDVADIARDAARIERVLPDHRPAHLPSTDPDLPELGGYEPPQVAVAVPEGYRLGTAPEGTDSFQMPAPTADQPAVYADGGSTLPPSRQRGGQGNDYLRIDPNDDTAGGEIYAMGTQGGDTPRRGWLGRFADWIGVGRRPAPHVATGERDITFGVAMAYYSDGSTGARRYLTTVSPTPEELDGLRRHYGVRVLEEQGKLDRLGLDVTEETRNFRQTELDRAREIYHVLGGTDGALAERASRLRARYDREIAELRAQGYNDISHGADGEGDLVDLGRERATRERESRFAAARMADYSSSRAYAEAIYDAVRRGEVSLERLVARLNPAQRYDLERGLSSLDYDFVWSFEHTGYYLQPPQEHYDLRARRAEIFKAFRNEASRLLEESRGPRVHIGGPTIALRETNVVDFETGVSEEALIYSPGVPEVVAREVLDVEFVRPYMTAELAPVYRAQVGGQSGALERTLAGMSREQLHTIYVQSSEIVDQLEREIAWANLEGGDRQTELTAIKDHWRMIRLASGRS